MADLLAKERWPAGLPASGPVRLPVRRHPGKRACTRAGIGVLNKIPSWQALIDALRMESAGRRDRGLTGVPANPPAGSRESRHGIREKILYERNDVQKEANEK